MLVSLIMSSLAFVACNNADTKSQPAGNANTSGKDTMQHAATGDDSQIKQVAATYTSVDTKVAAAIKEITDHYLHIKNALAADNSDEAANGGKAMEAAIGKIDKSLLTAQQKTTFDQVADDLKEHAEHMGKNAGNIKHQREHFSMMSEDLYTLVKAFGGGRPLYHDHCPMYNDNKGAIWLSEFKEVKNPYFGKEMPTCGKVQEVIQ